MSMPMPNQVFLAPTQVEKDEAESWESAIDFANTMNPPLHPINDSARIPSRLNGRYVFIKLDGEWELAKVDISAREKNYRYRLEASRSFGFADFNTSTHGRNSKNVDDELCWILLQ